MDIEFTDNQTLLVKGMIRRLAPLNGDLGFVETSFEQTFKLLHSIDQDNVSVQA